MKKVRLFFLILIGCLANLKAMSDGEVLRFDEETKQMLERAVEELEGLYPSANKFSKNIVEACKSIKKDQDLVQSIIGQIERVTRRDICDDRDRGDCCEVARYILVLEEERATLSPKDRLTVDAAIEFIRREFEKTDTPLETPMPISGYI